MEEWSESGSSYGGSDYESDVSLIMIDDGDVDEGVDYDDFYSEDEREFNDNMSTDSEDSMSEANNEPNEGSEEPTQSGSETEFEDDASNEAVPVEVPRNQDNDVPAQELEEPAEEGDVVQSQKRIKLDETVKEVKVVNEDLIDEDQRCPICLDVWSNAGEHRLCSLRCGHLFGLKCIEQWFKMAVNASARKCPECNTKASKKDIRVLYAKGLISIDTTEIEKLKQTIKEVTTKKEAFENELKLYKTKETLYEQQLTNLKKRISVLEKAVENVKSNRNTFNAKYDEIVLKQVKVYDICNNGSCRVLGYNPWMKILVASFGNKVSRVFMDTSSIHVNGLIHNGPIRDVAFQEQHPNILLSVGFDKKIMLTDLRTNLTLHSYLQDTNLWSCCWSNYSSQTFFVGGHRGNVGEYDIRNLHSSVSVKENSEDRSPVVSLASVPTSSPALRAGGFLACQLNSCYAYAFKESNYIKSRIDMEGPFTSMRYNEKDNHVLVSCRANNKNPNVRHVVCTIEKNEDLVKFNTVHSYNAGTSQKLLSRPCFMNLQNDTLVVANNESLKNIVAWSITTGEQVYTIPVTEPVVDIYSFECGATLQAVLTLNKLHLYQYQDTSL